MKNRLKRIRAAVLMGLAWALVWAPVAVLIGTLIVDPDGSMDEMWVAVGAYPGFLCGALFSAVIGMAAGRQRLDELSLSRVIACGAVSGLLVGLLPLILGTPSIQRPLWFWASVIIGPIILMSAVSAIVSALLTRMVTNRHLPSSAGAA